MLVDGVLTLRVLARFDEWAGWTPLTYSVDAAGAAVVACARDEDVQRAATDETDPLSGLADRPWAMAVFRTTAASNGSNSCWQQLLVAPVDVVRPHVLCLATGSILVVGAHAARTKAGEIESNALLFEHGSTQPKRWSVGDGVLDVQDSPGGTIWIAYTDEGVTGDYGRRGWGRLSPEEWIAPMGEHGLVRHAGLSGPDPVGYRVANGALAIAGCHALNVWGEDAWLTYHPGHPLVSYQAGGRRQSWATPFPAVVDAFAVTEEFVVAHAGPRRGRHRAWLAQLRADGSTRARELSIRLEDDTPVARLRRVVGRGAVLHAFTDDAWYAADLRSL